METKPNPEGLSLLLVNALLSMDPANDEQWTSDGLPRMDYVHEKTGDKTITRQQVVNENPDFSRSWLEAKMSEPAADDQAKTDEPAADETEAESAPLPTTDEVWPPGESDELPSPEELFSMPVPDIMASEKLTAYALGLLADDEKQLEDYIEKAKVDLDQVRTKIEILNRASDEHQRRKPKGSPVQRWQKRMLEVRKKRMEAAKNFVEAGTTTDSVRAVLQSKSPLDQAVSSKRRPVTPSHLMGKD